MALFTFSQLSPDDPWNTCLAHFFQSLERRSGSSTTLYHYSCHLRLFFADGRHPTDYTRADVETFIHRPSTGRRNAGRPVSIATVNLRLTVISSFYHYASIYTVPGPDGKPVLLFTQPSPTLGIHHGRPDRHYRVLSDDEVSRFFAVIPGTVNGLRDRAIFLTYLLTARRCSEIVHLCYGDIQSVVFVENGTHRAGWLYHFRGKGHARIDDSAELPGAAKAAIDRYLEASGRNEKIKPSDPLFLNDFGTAMQGYTINKLMKRYATLAGINPDHLSTHAWRHTSARARRYDLGEDVLHIKELLRHKSLNTTYYYLEHLQGPADPFAKKLEEKWKF